MSTSTPVSSSSNPLALVNSFYGPGAVACWYLTCLSCLMSWTFHPKKRAQDTITSDFIAVVTFPTVASAHLITQILHWPSESSIGDEIRGQLLASLAASLIITETYLSVSVILVLPGLFPRSSTRISLLALSGIFCVTSETYLFFALPSIRTATEVFERSFLINSFPLLVLSLVFAWTLVGLLVLYLYFVSQEIRQQQTATAEPVPELAPEAENHYGLARNERRIAYLTLVSLFITFLSIASSFANPVLDLLASFQRDKTSWSGRRSFVDEFFPRTETRIMDLDQGVALLTGMTILGFSLYSAVDAMYLDWCLKEEERQRLLETHLQNSQESHQRQPIPASDIAPR